MSRRARGNGGGERVEWPPWDGDGRQVDGLESGHPVRDERWAAGEGRATEHLGQDPTREGLDTDGSRDDGEELVFDADPETFGASI